MTGEQAATLLCIEDETALRRDIVEELSDQGFRVLEAANGQDGLDAIRVHRPDLVICDVRMPGMTGLDVLQTVRRELPALAEMPFVMLTALSSREQVLEGKRLGADDYLTKPVDFDLLVSTVRARLRQVALIRAHNREILLEHSQAIMARVIAELRPHLGSAHQEAGVLDRGVTREVLDCVAQNDRPRIDALLDDNRLQTTLLTLSGALENARQAMRQSARVLENGRLLVSLRDGALCREGLDLKALILNAVKTLREDALHVVVDGEQTFFRGDRTLLQHALSTLITNAVRHSPRDSLVSVVLSSTDQVTTISVRDDGPGIPQEVVEALSRDGMPAEEGRKAPLSLSVAKRVAQLHGGGLELRSTPRRGSVAVLTLPRGPVQDGGS